MKKKLKLLAILICIITQISCSSASSTNTELEALTIIGNNSYLVPDYVFSYLRINKFLKEKIITRNGFCGTIQIYNLYVKAKQILHDRERIKIVV